MFEAHIYADEAGTMPVKDADDAFVAAAFAVTEPDSLMMAPLRPSGPMVTASLLLTAGAYPNCRYVRPFPGYAAVLERRMDIRNAIALSTRRRTGVNAQYVAPDGIRARNFIWTLTMTAAALGCLQDVVHHIGVPTKVKVFFNAKSFAHEQRTFARNQTARIGLTLQRVLARATARSATVPHHTPPVIQPDMVSVEWDRDSGFSGLAPGMFLAHSLATNMGRELRRKRRRAGMRAALVEVGYPEPGVLIDMTQILLDPPSDEALQRYERETGLVLPH